MEKKPQNILTGSQVRRRVRDFALGDLVQVEEEEGKMTEAYIIRFFPNLVRYETESGRRFTTDYLAASQARLLRPAGFREHTEEMDRNAVLDALGERKIGDGKEV